MKTLRRVVVMLVLIGIVVPGVSALGAERERNQAINICAIAIPLMNLYVVNYEYLLADRHGLAARLEYIPLADGDIEGTGYAAVLDYRWHLTPRMESFFLGPYLRYRYAEGKGTVGGVDFDWSIPELNLGVNAGYRWIHDPTGINVVVVAGYGYAWTSQELSSDDTTIGTAFAHFKDANAGTENFLDAPFFGEVSFGWAY